MTIGKNDELPVAELVLEKSGWEHLKVASPGDAVNYAITGHESQVLTMKLQTGDSLQGEPGTMLFLTNGVKQRVSYEGCCERCCSGEDCFVMNFTNSGSTGGAAYAALCPNFPTAKVVPVDMSSPHVNGSLIAQQGTLYRLHFRRVVWYLNHIFWLMYSGFATGSFMASYGDVSLGVDLDFNLMRCCCSGLGLVRQKLNGTGTVFLASTGTIVQKVSSERIHLYLFSFTHYKASSIDVYIPF